jgi:hypothetical protein
MFGHDRILSTDAMAILPLHQELSDLSGDNPSGYITTASLARFALERLTTTIQLLKGKSIGAGAGVLSASLRDVRWSKPPAASLASPKTSILPDREVDVVITSDFTVLIDIFISSNPASLISEVEMAILDARVHMRAENNLLILEGAHFDSKQTITRTANADNLLELAGIDPLEAARVEGHIGYGITAQAITKTLAERTEIPLATVFPAVNLGTAIKLAILDRGDALGIIPTEKVTIETNARCSCSEGPDFKLDKSTITNTAPADPKPGDEFGKVVIGGPIPDNKDPLKDFGARRPNQSGIAGLYIPKAFAETLTIEVMPSVTIVAEDKGVIGYRAEATVAFKNPRVSFDLIGGGILLDIDLNISITAYCDLDILCTRIPIGWAVVVPTSGSQANLQLGFYPSIDRTGAVRLKTTLNKADMGSYVALVVGVGTALTLLGVTAWIGFLIDVVLSSIVTIKLPMMLRDEVGKYLGSKEWKLINGMPVTNPAINWFPAAPFDVGPTSILASIEYRG